MKYNRLALIACLALIVAGVFFTTNRAEARVFTAPAATGCTAPVGGDSVGNCGSVQSHAAVSTARHHHFRFHHFRGHHTHHRFHHHH